MGYAAAPFAALSLGDFLRWRFCQEEFPGSVKKRPDPERTARAEERDEALIGWLVDTTEQDLRFLELLMSSQIG